MCTPIGHTSHVLCRCAHLYARDRQSTSSRRGGSLAVAVAAADVALAVAATLALAADLALAVAADLALAAAVAATMVVP